MNIENRTVISIDDNQINLQVVESYMKTLSLHVKSFQDPQEALNFAKDNEHDLIIVDYMMPHMNGLEFIEAYRDFEKDIPIVMLTAVGDDVDLQVKALELGATDFLSKPIVPPSLKARISNLIKIRINQQMLQNKKTLLEQEVKEATKQIEDREHEALKALGKAAEYKDPETGAHIERVANYSKILAASYGLDKNMQDVIFYASPFHDMGKVGIADSILLKPNRLTDAEFEVIKTHSKIGYEILKDSTSKYLKAGSIIAMTHHEKYDGTGYPNKLKGEAIPILGRIVAVADVFDALTSKRPYKEPWSFEKALDFLNQEKNKHFDPKVVECFIDNVDQIKNIYETIKEDFDT